MDNIDARSIEFIDLSDVEEKERNWIISSLHAWDPNVKVPWRKNTYHRPPVKQTVSSVPFQHIPNNLGAVANVIPPNMILTANANANDGGHKIIYNHEQIYPMYNVAAGYPQHLEHPMPYHQQSTYLNAPCITAAATAASSAGGSSSTIDYSHQIPQAHLIFDNNDVNYAYINNNNSYVNTEIEPTQKRIEQNGTSNGQVGSKYATETPVVGNSCDESPKVNHESQSQKEDAPRKSVGKSWASLFSTANSAGAERKDTNEEKPSNAAPPFVQSTTNAVVNNETEDDEKGDAKSVYNDPVFFILGEYLCEYSIDHRTISLQPRGLINRSNYCYINSILQALLACPPVYNLLNSLSEKITTAEMKKVIPVIDQMTAFVKEFQYLPAGQRVSRRVDKNQKQDPNLIINCDIPFEPGYIYRMLNGMRSDTFVIEGRQEDAEEFLGCLLNGLNDEMLELMKLVDKRISKPKVETVNAESDADREWQVMGPKNKGCVTRRTEVIQTPISDIFNGHLRSRLHRTGDKSTDNIQPFFTLQLNIEKVSTVREALEALVCKNQLEGVTSSRTNEEVEAWQQVTIEELPYVLVLHLKCFDFKLDGCTKIIKALEFPIDLKIDSKLLSSKTNYSPKEKQYKLFAVVYHDGKEATKGHYITDAYHVGYSRWIRYDDASIKAVPEELVLKPHGTRVPYLLFYRRSDSIRSK